MKKMIAMLLALMMVLSLAACGGMKAEEKAAVEQELIAALGGKSYYCRNHPMKSGSQGGTLEEDIISVTFSEDCSTADVVWSYQITPFHNGTAQRRNRGPVITIPFTANVEMNVKNKETVELVLTYSYYSPVLEKWYEGYKDTLTVRFTDETFSGIRFDKVNFSIIRHDDEGYEFGTFPITQFVGY